MKSTLAALLLLTSLGVGACEGEEPEPTEDVTAGGTEMGGSGEDTTGESGESSESSDGSNSCEQALSEMACTTLTVNYGACGWASGAVYALDDLTCASGETSGTCWMSDVDDDCGEHGNGVAWREVEGGVEVVAAAYGCGGWPPPGFLSCEHENAPVQCDC